MGSCFESRGNTDFENQRRHSEDDYFENLLAVWTHYGRQPKYREMDEPPSAITSGAYEAKWGSWGKSLLAFVERVNSDTRQVASETREEMSLPTGVDDIPEPISGGPISSKASKGGKPRQNRKQEDQRQIKLGLRYDVLRRDRFRCVLCGASPATVLGCDLHVDHILPWSKGGKTVEENLRTLCEPCNLGKSAKFESEQPSRIESIGTDISKMNISIWIVEIIFPIDLSTGLLSMSRVETSKSDDDLHAEVCAAINELKASAPTGGHPFLLDFRYDEAAAKRALNFLRDGLPQPMIPWTDEHTRAWRLALENVSVNQPRR